MDCQALSDAIGHGFGSGIVPIQRIGVMSLEAQAIEAVDFSAQVSIFTRTNCRPKERLRRLYGSWRDYAPITILIFLRMLLAGKHRSQDCPPNRSKRCSPSSGKIGNYQLLQVGPIVLPEATSNPFERHAGAFTFDQLAADGRNTIIEAMQRHLVRECVGLYFKVKRVKAAYDPAGGDLEVRSWHCRERQGKRQSRSSCRAFGWR